MTRSALLPKAVALAFLLTVPGLVLAAAPAPPTEAPRALSEAERQAVVLAAEYLDRGPAAWWDRLASTSPLRRLGREAALAEIEVRAGAPAGAEWALEAAPGELRGAVFTLGFPSGVDDTLVLDLARENGAWKIAALRTAAEPVAAKGSPEPLNSLGAAPARPSALAPLARSLASIPLWLLLVVGAAGALLLAAAALERHQRALAIPLGLAGGLIAASVLVALLLPRALATGPVAVAGGGDPGFAELRSLLPLRRALTQAEGAVSTEVPAETRAAGVAGQVAQLWWAQNLLGGMDLRGVDRVLREFPSPGGFPLAELLRARVAFLRLEEVPTATGFQRAAAVGVAHEGLLYESAQAFLLLGFREHARQSLHQLGALGARRGATWYALARIAAFDDQSRDAGQYFRAGWQLEPSPRAEILDTPLLTGLLGDLQIRQLIHLGDAEEPVVACPQASQRAIALPAGFEARLLGGTLRIHRGETELRVPGGCDLAPAGTPSDAAGVWARQRAESLLARLPTLIKAARTPGALAQPAVRQRTEDAAEALAERRRWADLLALTESLSGEPASLPPSLVRLRADALRSSGRDTEARDLLILLAKGNTADRRTDPATLYELAHLLADEGSFDTAMKLAAKADSQLPFESSGNFLRQLRMEKRLAVSSKVFRSPHFAVLYQPERGEEFARKTARILEAERQRLLAWIPLASSRVIEVHLLPLDDFKLGYSPGMDVLGIYDGKIRVPLGNAPKFVPFIVSLLTHELAHALITEKTADQAPRWFQEGLAQHRDGGRRRQSDRRLPRQGEPRELPADRARDQQLLAGALHPRL